MLVVLEYKQKIAFVRSNDNVNDDNQPNCSQPIQTVISVVNSLNKSKVQTQAGNVLPSSQLLTPKTISAISNVFQNYLHKKILLKSCIHLIFSEQSMNFCKKNYKVNCFIAT